MSTTETTNQTTRRAMTTTIEHARQTLRRSTAKAAYVALADALGLSPKTRHGTAMWQKRQERSANQPVSDALVDMPTRLHEMKRERWAHVVTERGFETSIEEEHREVEISIMEQRGGLLLMGADGWRHYSRRFGSRRVSLRYLCGTDDNGRWAIRVPGTVDTIADALSFTIPTAVQKAEAAGKQVLRQGDVFAIETTKANDGKGDLPESHTFDQETRLLTHEGGHEALHVPFPARFVRGISLAPRSSRSRTRFGD